MAITKEYERKIDVFLTYLPKRAYKKIADTKSEGFLTYEKLSLDEAKAHEKETLIPGTECGKKWEYLWFFTKVQIPDGYEGSIINFKADYKEGTVFVNGKIVGAIDRRHREITLTKCAKSGEIFEIAMEVYAGHDGPVRMAEQKIQTAILAPGVPNEEFGDNINQLVIKDGEFGEFNNEIFLLETEIELLYDLYNILDKSTLRAASISKALKAVCNAVDIEAESEEFIQMVRTAREILKPVLACKNGSTAPEIYAVSHSHLDLEWLWTREETRRKVARTMGNQLRLLEEYPEQKYIQSQAWILNTIKNEYPDLYEEVKQAVRDGKIIPDGAAWVEFDANISSGESIIRQFMFGKNFFRDEFGVESEMFWLPDSFGVSGALPQIMKKCGIKYFVNCKLKWLYNEADVFPHSSFIWKGIDGTEILSYMGTGRFCGYQNTMLPGDVNAIWEKNEDKEELPYQMMAYGFGDGGGGATRKQYEMFKREENLEGMPKVTIASPVDFFEKVEKECNVNTTFADELYYPCHRGVYTSQAKTKDLNRRNELALREAEMWSALLDADIKSETDELWKVLLFDQFHDILPGSAIRRVYEVVEAELGESLKRAKEITAEVLSGSTDKEKNTITVANSLSWERSSLVPLPEGFTSIKDTEGNLVDTQSIDDSVYACVSVPSCGYKSFVLGNDEITASIEEVSSHTLENDLIKAEFNKKGEIISVIDKESGVEFLASASNKFRMYQDLPTYSDAWDIDSFYEDLEVDMGNDVKLSNVVCGKLLSYFDVTKKVGKSCIKQRISLKKDSKSIIFETEVDWRESHKLLKVDFDTNIQTDHLISEVQYGYINRSNHKNRQYDKDRFEVCQLKWSALTEENRGAAILNDNKYGISSDNGKMSLTLLKSPEHPARDADKGIQNFTYAFMPYEGSFFDSGVVTSGYELNCPVVVTKGKTEEKSYFAIDKSNVIIDAIKIAEDNSGDVIVRMYESKKSATNCRVDFGFEVKKAYITNMLEENEEEIEVCNNSISLKFKAFEVVTVRLKK